SFRYVKTFRVPSRPSWLRDEKAPRMVQKRYFTPIWICRDVVTVDVMRPQLGATSPAALVNAIRPDGTAKFARFRKLNASRRACTLRPAGRRNDLTSDRSAWIRPGPIKLLRSRFPRWPAGGSSNA